MQTLYPEILSYCQSKFPEEACGLIILWKGRYKWVPCENIHQKKDTEFAISSQDFKKAYDLGQIVCVVHSHTDGNKEFSDFDRQSQQRQGYDWLLVSTDGNSAEISATITAPKKAVALYGRQYKFGVYDCLTFVRDWYKQEWGIHINDYDRKENFWDYGEELYLDNYQAEGFVEVALQDIRYGDVILLALGGPITAHAGVYLGNNKFGHHLNDRLSSVDIYGAYYQDRTTKVIRHKSRIENEESNSERGAC